jgi:hypothetical protein
MAYDRLLERLYLRDNGWIVKGATALLARDIRQGRSRAAAARPVIIPDTMASPAPGVRRDAPVRQMLQHRGRLANPR